MSETLQDLIDAAVAETPWAPAFIYQDRIFAYRHLSSFMAAAARLFEDRGIRPGDRVGVTMAHSPLHCIAVLALGRIGATSIPLPSSLDPLTRGHLVREYGIRTIIGSDPTLAPTGTTLVSLDKMTVDPDQADPTLSAPRPRADTPFRIALTSGTVGTPKGVLHTQATFVARIRKTVFQCDRSTRYLAPDLHITVAMVHALGVLCAGGCVIFAKGYDVDSLVQAINLHGITHMLSAPANLRALANLSPEGGPRFPSLRHLRFIGGMPSRDLITKLARRCTPNIYISYAMTEVGIIAMATPETLAQDPESTGPLQPWAHLEAVDENDRPLPPGQEGEIRVQVEGMPTRYCLDVPADKNRFRNGWFYPGDRGSLGDDGLVRIKGRSDHLLNIGGRKFAPEYLEHILEEHPSVREAAVFLEATPDGELVPVAAVVARGQAEPEALAAYCLQRLDFLAPKHYHFVTHLPRNLMSKLKREELVGWIKKVEKPLRHGSP